MKRAACQSASSKKFTYNAYSALLDNLQDSGYRFAGFREADHLLAAGVRFALMRHDIDFDISAALAMAELEHRAGIRSTYFFMVRTQHYNVFSRENTKLVQRLLAWGHMLGLHFDSAAYDAAASSEQLARWCRREVQMLEAWFEAPVEAVSYHRPQGVVLTGDPSTSAPLPHTYIEKFMREIFYVSESKAQWRFNSEAFRGAVESGRPLHILVHPIWWNQTAAAPYDRLRQFVHQHQESLELSVAQNNTVYRVGRFAHVIDNDETRAA